MRERERIRVVSGWMQKALRDAYDLRVLGLLLLVFEILIAIIVIICATYSC